MSIDYIRENYPDTLLADGFDEAIIGMDYISERVIYSVIGCLNILIDNEDMTEQEALEYLDFNTFTAYVGEKTPIWCDDRMGD